MYVRVLLLLTVIRISIVQPKRRFGNSSLCVQIRMDVFQKIRSENGQNRSVRSNWLAAKTPREITRFVCAGRDSNVMDVWKETLEEKLGVVRPDGRGDETDSQRSERENDRFSKLESSRSTYRLVFCWLGTARTATSVIATAEWYLHVRNHLTVKTLWNVISAPVLRDDRHSISKWILRDTHQLSTWWCWGRRCSGRKRPRNNCNELTRMRVPLVVVCFQVRRFVTTSRVYRSRCVRQTIVFPINNSERRRVPLTWWKPVFHKCRQRSRKKITTLVSFVYKRRPRTRIYLCTGKSLRSRSACDVGQ